MAFRLGISDRQAGLEVAEAIKRTLGPTRALAVELAPDGIRVNGIAPGRFVTRMTRSYLDDPAGKAIYLTRTPLGRYGESDNLVGPVLFPCSSWSGYVTGIMLPVDGGYLIG